MTPDQTELVERIREAIAEEPVQRETSMFGVRAFMVNDRMIVCAQKDGGLLVRVADDRHDELLARPGASQPTMGGRDMGPGWILVDADALDEAELAFWIDTAMEHNRAVTGIRR